MHGCGIALGKVPKNAGMDEWIPAPDSVDKEAYDLSQFYSAEWNGSYYDDWYSDYDPCSNQQPEPIDIEEKVSAALHTWAPPVFICFGIIGNFLSAYIMIEFSDRFLSSCMYFTLLSITEILVVVTCTGNDWLKSVHQVDFTQFVLMQPNAACQVYSFFTSFVDHLSTWMVVVPIAEMAVMSRNFSRAHKISTPSRIKNTVLLTVCCVVIANAHFFFTFSLLHPTWDPMCNQRQCMFIPVGWGETFRDWVLPILGVQIFGMLGPIMSVFVGLFCILLRSSCCGKSSAKKKIMENRFFIYNEAVCDYRLICIVMAVFFISTAMPEACYNLFEFLLEKTGTNENYDNSSFAKRMLAQSIGVFSRDMFISTKIVLYAALWKQFRKRLLSMISVYHFITERKKRQKILEQRFLPPSEIRNDTAIAGLSEETLSLTNDTAQRYGHCV